MPATRLDPGRRWFRGGRIACAREPVDERVLAKTNRIDSRCGIPGSPAPPHKQATALPSNLVD